MGLPLGPLLANVFVISLEDNTLPKLELYLCNWKRYVDDTFVYILPDKIDMILLVKFIPSKHKIYIPIRIIQWASVLKMYLQEEPLIPEWKHPFIGKQPVRILT